MFAITTNKLSEFFPFFWRCLFCVLLVLIPLRDGLSSEVKQYPLAGRVKTVNLVINYRENRHPNELPETHPAQFPIKLRRLLIEILDLAELRVVEDEQADLSITITGKSLVSSQRYRRGLFLVRAKATFTGTVKVEATGYNYSRPIRGKLWPSPVLVVPRGTKKMEGTLKAVDATEISNLPEVLMTFVYWAFGPMTVARGLQSNNPLIVEKSIASLSKPINSYHENVRNSVVKAIRKYLSHEQAHVRRMAVRLLGKSRHWTLETDAPEIERLNFFLFGSWPEGKSQFPISSFSKSSIEAAQQSMILPPVIFTDRRKRERKSISLAPRHVERAAFLLADQGEAGVRALIEVLKQTKGQPHPAIGWALARTGEQGRKALKEFSRDPVLNWRSKQGVNKLVLQTLHIMGEHLEPNQLKGLPSSLTAKLQEPLKLTNLLKQLEHEESKERLRAVNQLVGVRDPRVFSPVLKVLQGDADQKVRDGAAVKLGIYGDRRALTALQDKESTIYKRAIIRLQAFGY